MDFAITPPNRMELAYASPHRRGHFLVFSHAMDVWRRIAHEDEDEACVVLPGGILGGGH